MPDGDEHAVRRHLGESPGLDVAEDDALHLQGVLATHHFLEHRVPEHRNLRVLEQPVLQDLFGAEAVAAVHHRDLGGEIGEEQRLLDRGIAAADHDHFLVAVEKAVAGGAGGDAVTLELLLGGKLQPARLRAGGDDHAVGEIAVAGIAFQPERPMRQIHLAHVIGDDPGPHVLGLLLHLLHQPWALDDLGEARVVLDVGGDGELPAGLDALDQHRFQHGAGGIDRGGVAGRPGADDDDLGVGDLAHGSRFPSRKVCWARAAPAATSNLGFRSSYARYADQNATAS